jgi:hypothetical protein
MEIIPSKFSYATPGIREDTRIQGKQGTFEDSTFSIRESNHILPLNEQHTFPVPFLVLSSSLTLVTALCVRWKETS